jgi:pSer/pThr/pTyr-binding forkhead associated (FHA) protein
MLLGRSPYCSVILSGSLVSRQHCIFRLQHGALYLEDLGSTNGTSVNGERVSGQRRLAGGDRVRIGGETLEVLEGELPDPGSARKATLSESPACQDGPSGHDLEEEPPTQTDCPALDSIEAAVTAAIGKQQPADMATSIQRAVDSLQANIVQGNHRLSLEEHGRLVAVLDQVSAWCPSGELDEWRVQVLETLRSIDR